MVPTHHGKLGELLATQGAAPTAMNLAHAQNLYFRGLSLALFHSQARYHGPGPEDADFVRTMLQQAIPDRVRATSAPVPVKPSVGQAVNTPAPPVEQSFVDDRIVTIGEDLVRERGKDKRWDGKMQTQARQLYALMDRFLVEECDVRGIAALTQQHLAKFVTFLRHDIYKFYGRSSMDAQRRIDELRALAAGKPEVDRGIEGGTLNRHLTNIDQLFNHARAQGLTVAPDLKTVGLRSKKANRGRARDQRPKLAPAVAARIFHAAPFTGCASWDRPLEPGCEIYHRALYFVPLLLQYGGGRREEICGLEVDDVIEGPIPYIHVRANATRRIKNAQSDRFLPIHPEVLRLGFLDYVAAIRALGYKLVFPCLFSPTTSSPLGDRLYDEFKPILVWACEQEKADPDTVIHSFRHGFNSTLKAKHVRAEERADLMGHGGDSETTERYADPIQLRRALQLLKKIPVVTVHLKAVPIQLVPWVEQKSVAPFSRARRKKPADEAVA
jgi:integrase